MDVVDRCRHAFMEKSSGLMDKEIEAFWIYHDDFYSYTTRMEEYRNTMKDTEQKWKEYVVRPFQHTKEEFHVLLA